MRLALGLLLSMLGTSPLPAQDTLLAQARAQMAAGAYADAARSYRQVLDTAAAGPELLAEAIDAFESAGAWPEAVPLLDRYLAQRPDDAGRVRQRGLYAAWSGDRSAALALLARAVELAPAKAAFRASLAEVLSWSPKDRARARWEYERALSLDPTDLDVLVGYGDLQSWTGETRQEAARLYERALALDPGNLRARVGLANLRAWQGAPRASLAAYDSVLAAHPNHVGALLGKGGALNQEGRFMEARRVLQRALALAPDDGGALLELSRADLGLRDFESAQTRLATLPRPLAPGARNVGDSARRALGTFVEATGWDHDRRDRLDARGARVALRQPVGTRVAVQAAFEPARWRDAQGEFWSRSYRAGLTAVSSRLEFSATGGVRDVEDVFKSQLEGDASLGWTPSATTRFHMAVARGPNDETRLAMQGTPGGAGPVNVGRLRLGFELSDLPGPFDAHLTAMAAEYRATGLERNQMTGVEAQLGVTLRRHSPWIRAAGHASGSRFDYNADTLFATAPSREGGYFSPSRYWLSQGVLQFAQGAGTRFLFEADGRVGREWVRQVTGASQESRTATAVNARMVLRLGSGVDAALGYLYVNTADAFELSAFRLTLRGYLP